MVREMNKTDLHENKGGKRREKETGTREFGTRCSKRGGRRSRCIRKKGMLFEKRGKSLSIRKSVASPKM